MKVDKSAAYILSPPAWRGWASIRSHRLLCLAFLWVSVLGPLNAATNSPLLVLNLQIPTAAIARLEANKWSDETVDAKLNLGTLTNLPVKIRHRGKWSRSWGKTPLKVFLPTNAMENRSCLNLNSTYRDPSWMRERLALHLYAAAGVPSPRTRFAEVSFNSRFRGVYVEVEQVDAGFLRSRGLAGGEVYKAVGGDERRLAGEAAYRQAYEKQNKTKSGYQSLIDFCAAVNSTGDVDTFFQEKVELDRYISYLAVNILVQNWDGYNKNHVLVHDAAKSGKWFVVPWDVDRTFGDWPQANSGGAFEMVRYPLNLGIQSSPGITGWNRLQNRFWQSKTLRQRLADRVEELLKSEFTPEKLNPLIDAWVAEIQPRVAADQAKWGSGSQLDFKAGIKELKSYIVQRRAFVKPEIGSLKN